MMNIKQLEIAAIGDEDLISGLRLAGVGRYRLMKDGTSEEVRQAFTEFMNEPGIGIVVILEEYAGYIEDLIAQAKEGKTQPLVVIEVPSKYGTRHADVAQYYKAYIRKFIGFDIEI